MKTLLSLTLLFSLLFVGCEKDPDGPFVPTPDNSTTINFEIGYLTSDKPAAEISATKDFEDAITIYKLWIFKNSDDEAILFKEFTADEIKAMKVNIGLPKLSTGEKLSFISIANHNWFKHTTSKKEILKISDSSPTVYNASGSYNDLMTKCMNTEGFTMSSQDELTVATESIYTVRTKLQKTVSKIEVFVDNDYMRKGNANYNNPDLKGFFKATKLTMESDCNTSLFKPQATNNTSAEAQGGAINTEEYKLTGLGYFSKNDSNSELVIRLWANEKNMGTVYPPSEYFTQYRYEQSIKPNKHYIFHWIKVGTSMGDIILDKIEEKDWVKTN